MRCGGYSHSNPIILLTAKISIANRVAIIKKSLMPLPRGSSNSRLRSRCIALFTLSESAFRRRRLHALLRRLLTSSLGAIISLGLQAELLGDTCPEAEEMRGELRGPAPPFSYVR